MALSNCSECYVLSAVTCYGSVKLPVGLTANHAYHVNITDMHGHVYTQAVTSDSSGDIIVDLDAMDREFTAFSGSFEITISTSATTNTAESFTISATAYNCIRLSFFDQD